jgi:hypothetical protein
VLRKRSYLELPPIRGAFGFIGDGADEAADTMIALVKEAMQDTKEHANTLWRTLNARGVSMTPTNVEALRQTYLGLAEGVMDHFDRLPHPRVRRASLFQAITRWFSPETPPQEIAAAVLATERFALHLWRGIGEELLGHAAITPDPPRARAGVSNAMRYVYMNLGDEVVTYFNRHS